MQGKSRHWQESHPKFDVMHDGLYHNFMHIQSDAQKLAHWKWPPVSCLFFLQIKKFPEIPLPEMRESESTESVPPFCRLSPENWEVAENLAFLGGGGIAPSSECAIELAPSEFVCHIEGALVIMEARSNLNPSTCISCTQYLRQSKINFLAWGWLQLNVFPHPL